MASAQFAAFRTVYPWCLFHYWPAPTRVKKSGRSDLLLCVCVCVWQDWNWIKKAFGSVSFLTIFAINKQDLLVVFDDSLFWHEYPAQRKPVHRLLLLFFSFLFFSFFFFASRRHDWQDTDFEDVRLRRMWSPTRVRDFTCLRGAGDQSLAEAPALLKQKWNCVSFFRAAATPSGQKSPKNLDHSVKCRVGTCNIWRHFSHTRPQQFSVTTSWRCLLTQKEKRKVLFDVKKAKSADMGRRVPTWAAGSGNTCKSGLDRFCCTLALSTKHVLTGARPVGSPSTSLYMSSLSARTALAKQWKETRPQLLEKPVHHHSPPFTQAIRERVVV